MANKRLSLWIGVCVLGSILLIAGTFALSISSRTNGSLAPGQPMVTDTPLPPLPVPTFYLPTPKPPDTPPPPPPSPTPVPIETIEYLKSLPTIDWSKIGTPAPGTPVLPAPTLNPTDESARATAWAVTPPPLPTRFHVTPDGNWRRYIDPNLGFTFVYPANWFVEAYAWPDYKFIDGYSMSLRNHNDAYAKSPLPNKDEIKIEIVVLPDSAKPLAATSLLNQVQNDVLQAGWTITEIADVSVAGTQGIRWVQKGDRIADGIVLYMFRDSTNGHVYKLRTSPANNSYLKEFDQIALSFELNKSTSQ